MTHGTTIETIKDRGIEFKAIPNIAHDASQAILAVTVEEQRLEIKTPYPHADARRNENNTKIAARLYKN